ncbi:MAG: MutS-related protein [Candidatus Nanoarchaeia archaeon]
MSRRTPRQSAGNIHNDGDNIISVHTNLYEAVLKLDGLEGKVSHHRALIIDNWNGLKINDFISQLFAREYKQKLFLEKNKEKAVEIKAKVNLTNSEQNYLGKILAHPLLNLKLIEDRQKIVFDYIENDALYYQALELKAAIYDEIYDSIYITGQRFEPRKIIDYANSIVKLYHSIKNYAAPEHIPKLLDLKDSLEKLPNFKALSELFSDSSIGKNFEKIKFYTPDQSTHVMTMDEDGNYMPQINSGELISLMISLTDRLTKSSIGGQKLFKLPLKEALDKLMEEYRGPLHRDEKIMNANLDLLRKFWLDEIGKKLISNVPHSSSINKDNYRTYNFGIENMYLLGAELGLPLLLARQARRWKEVGLPICKPIITVDKKDTFIIKKGYCPTIAHYKLTEEEKRNSSLHPAEKIPVERNFYFDETSKIIIISGPNMAGKSTLLREFAQHLYCTFIGGPVVAEYVQVNLVDQIFSILPGKDNPYKNHGGYVAELMPLVEKLKGSQHAPLTANTIVLLDEFGKTTDDKEHVEVNLDLLQFFNKIDATVLMTTHDKDIINGAKMIPNTKFMQVCAKYDKGAQKLIFTREFEEGIGESYGDLLAKEYGIETNTLDASYNVYLNNKKQP